VHLLPTAACEFKLQVPSAVAQRWATRGAVVFGDRVAFGGRIGAAEGGETNCANVGMVDVKTTDTTSNEIAIR